MKAIRRTLLTGLLTVPGVAALGGVAAAERPFTTGFMDGAFFQTDITNAQREYWMGEAQAVGGDLVRIQVSWNTVAGACQPQNPRDPADPCYGWGPTDDALEDAATNGFDVLLTFQAAPRWAEGAGKPAGSPDWSWRPQPRKLADFATALARRYSVAPPSGVNPVGFFQVWNEPNLVQYLSPQWVCRGGTGKRCDGGRWESASPEHYRKMLNASYDAINAVDPTDEVLVAGPGPYGDWTPDGRLIKGRKRHPPGLFIRELLCLNEKLRKKCGAVSRLDGLDAHIFPNLSSPDQSANFRDDIKVPDVTRNVVRPLRAAERKELVAGEDERGEIWVTELGWQTDPPADNSPSARQQALWLEEAFYELWRQGVTTITWFRIVDKLTPEGTNRYTGLHYRPEDGGQAKPSRQAYNFMFVTERIDDNTIRYWGRAPEPGAVEIERKAGDGWSADPVATATADPASRVFTGTAPLAKKSRGSYSLRAQMTTSSGANSSIVWKQR